MRIITSDYLKNKITQLETIDYIGNMRELNFEEKIIAINHIIDDNFNETKAIRKDNHSYDQDGKLKNDIREYLKNVKARTKVCKEYLQLIKRQRILDLENDKLTKISVDTDIVNLTANQTKLLDDLLHNHLDDYYMDDLLIVLKYIVENYSLIVYEEMVLNTLKKIISHISFDDKHNLEKIVLGLNSVKCSINHKLAKLNKNDSERIILNQFKSMIKNVINISKVESMKTYDYKFDIIEYWLSDEDNRIFLEKLFDRLPETVNIRSRDNEHILIHILKTYIDTYKIELRNQSKPFVSSTYLKNMYKLLMANNQLELLDSDEMIRQSLLENFSNFLRHSNYKRERIVAALAEIESLKNINDSEDDEIEFDEKEVNEQLSYIKELISLQNSDHRRVDLTNEKTLVIVNDSLKYNNYAYILNKLSNNDYSLKINVIDIASIVNENSPLDIYLRHHLFSNVNNDSFLIPNVNDFSLVMGRKMPTITFELIINEKGEVKDLAGYKSVSIVNTTIHSDAILASDKFPVYYQLLKVLKNDDWFNRDNSIKQLEEIVNEKCIKGIAKYFSSHNYPFIYKVQARQNSINFENNINALNGIFYKVNKEEFKTIYSIICEDYNYAYYAIDNIGHRSKHSNCHSDLLNPLDSYIGIFLQRLIDEFYLNSHHVVNNDYWSEEAISLVEKANSYKLKQRDNIKKMIK